MNWHMMFTYGPFAFFALTFLMFVLPLRTGVRAQARWAMFLLFCFAKFLCFKSFGGHAFCPDLPELVIWAWDFLYSGAMILCALGVLTVFFRFRCKAVILPAIAWGLSAWGLYNGLEVPAVREVELRFADLPTSLDGYRICQLTDLHCSPAARTWRTKAVVDKVNALGADIICLTGDSVDGYVGRMARHLAPIRRLRAKDGVYACTGNHEYYIDASAWRMQFYPSVKNIRYLTNECVFPRPGLALAGVPDKTGWSRKLDAAPDVRGAFAAATNGEFRVLLQHQPQTAEENAREVGVNLQLSGHTHGGIAPGFRSLVARDNGGFVRGLYRLGESMLYVSAGSGQWAGFPMRLFNPSEITLITLRR